jgi:protein involved in polysaccharide export with SLBB domain
MKYLKKLILACTLAGLALQIGVANAAEGTVPAPGIQRSYVLTPSDVLELKVYQEDDLLTRAPIGPDGNITLPLLGSIQVAGKTAMEAAATIRSLFEQDYLVNPQISLTIVEYAKRRFSIMGQVYKPGPFEMPFDQEFDLFSAISMAVLYTRLASHKKITVQRTVNGETQNIKVDAEALSKNPKAPRFIIEPGDTVIIGERIF